VVNVVYSSNDLTVVGGPTRLDVDLNIGATGTRGSVIFTLEGNPALLDPILDFPTKPQIFDIFINVDNKSSDYLQGYQYVNKDATPSWEKVFKITPSVFNVNKVVTFSNGSANFNVNLTDLGVENLPFGTDFFLSSAYFNVSATISNINANLANDEELAEATHFPAATSVYVKDAKFDNAGLEDPEEFPLILPIELKAAEFASGSWSLINAKNVIVYLTISIADPTEIFNNLEEAE
jgi:hypothetical protein